MKLLQLINEAVSMSKYHSDVENVTNQSIKTLIDDLPSFEEKIPSPMKQDANFRGKYTDLVQHMHGVFIRQLSSIFTFNMNALFKNIPEINGESKIIFKQIKHGGHADGKFVVINKQYIIDIVTKIIDMIHEQSLEAVEDSGVKYTSAFFSITAADIQNDPEYKSIDFSSFTQTIIHELVHIVQNVRQHHRGGATEYRSYLTKDKKEFDDAVDNISTDATGRQMKLYYSSPQEIAAHSHNIAMNIMKNVKNINQLDSATIQANVKKYLDNIFNGELDAKETRVYNRYLKLVYSELVNALNK